MPPFNAAIRPLAGLPLLAPRPRHPPGRQAATTQITPAPGLIQDSDRPTAILSDALCVFVAVIFAHRIVAAIEAAAMLIIGITAPTDSAKIQPCSFPLWFPLRIIVSVPPMEP